MKTKVSRATERLAVADRFSANAAIHKARVARRAMRGAVTEGAGQRKVERDDGGGRVGVGGRGGVGVRG